MLTTPASMTTRRVAYRTAPDDDLAALHAVESEVQAELRPDLPPQPLDNYRGFARSFPASYTEWTWLVSAADGTPAAVGAAWFRDGDDPTTLYVDVQVRQPWRRAGVGAHLLALACDVAAETGRSRLVASSLDTVPAGGAFLATLGARPGRVNRTSELRLARVDWAMVDRWVVEGPARAPGYSLELVVGPYPPELRADAVAFVQIMETAPKDDLEVEEGTTTVEQIAEWDRSVFESGRERWVLLVRAPDGSCVGGSAVYFDAWNPTTAHQGDTGIDPAHRGHGLGKWVKAAMLDRLRSERPDVERVRTGNAYSNAPMLAINDALGFEVVYSRTDWQADVDAVRATLGRR